MSQPDSLSTQSKGDRIVAAAVAEADKRLQWNVAAYGEAWTGEYEDTEFIVAAAVREALAAEGIE